MRFTRLFCAVPVAVAFLLAGCNRSSKPAEAGAQKKVTAVTVVKPALTRFPRKVRQPGQIQAYERASIFPRIAGDIKEWKFDRGARVKKGEILAVLHVPEREEELGQKEALVDQAEAEVELA